MKYHFKIHHDGEGYWSECVELKGCVSQGKTRDELLHNLQEALNLYLDEPEDSRVIFPLPRRRVAGRNIITMPVDPHIALAFLVRRERLQRKWTQKQTAEQLGMPLYSYQRLESSTTANPEWKTLIRLCTVFPTLRLSDATS